MPASPLIPLPYDFKNISEETRDEHVAFLNRLRAESLPDDPPITREAHRARQNSAPPFLKFRHWELRDTALPGQPIVGMGQFQTTDQETNRHIASFQLSVLPGRRREGIARRLLSAVAEAARSDNRTLLMTHSSDRVPAAEPFLRRIGAEPGLRSHTNQLTLSDLDPAALRAYREEAEKRYAGEFELVYCQSPLPDEILIPAVELGNRVARDIPRGDLDKEQIEFTPEQMRQMDRIAVEAGDKMMALLVRHRSGALVGLTTITWHKHTSYAAQQGITGILPEYRGRGLGRYLKTAMLERLMAAHPETKFVRTDNADSNAGMLAINRALGFAPYRSEVHWQVPLERVLAYLGG